MLLSPSLTYVPDPKDSIPPPSFFRPIPLTTTSRFPYTVLPYLGPLALFSLILPVVGLMLTEFALSKFDHIYSHPVTPHRRLSPPLNLPCHSHFPFFPFPLYLVSFSSPQKKFLPSLQLCLSRYLPHLEYIFSFWCLPCVDFLNQG